MTDPSQFQVTKSVALQTAVNLLLGANLRLEQLSALVGTVPTTEEAAALTLSITAVANGWTNVARELRERDLENRMMGAEG